MILKKNKVFIIAEIGVNHNGSIKLAKKLIIKAKQSGADAVKFQNFITGNLVTKKALKADYQKINTGNNKNQFEMLKPLELSFDKYFILKKFCKLNNIIFITSPFDEISLDFVQKKLNCKFIKIPSGEINNYFILDKLKKTNTIIMSSGMNLIDDIAKSVNRIFKKKIYFVSKKKIIKKNMKIIKKIKNNFFVLHCVTDYPVENKYANIKRIVKMQNELGLHIGYSDHTKGILAPLIAVSLGARIIEKHLTLNTKMRGPDHSASLDPINFKNMCKKIREVELLLGEGKNEIQNCELSNIKIAKKSIVARTDIKAGEIITRRNITAKRPYNGVSPEFVDFFINTKAKKNYKKDELIK
jgi:N,N'-diacetyllegionaminate synthase